MEFTVSVGFNAETLKRIDAFLAAINTNAPAAKPAITKSAGTTARVIDAGQENSAGPGKPVIEKSNGKAQVITLEDLRKLAKEKGDTSKEFKAKKVIPLIKEYAESVSDVPEDKYTELYNKLKQLA